MDFGKLHVVIVHFPIGLAFSAVLADLLFLVARKDIFRQAAIYCLVIAALSAICAVVTGLILAGSAESVGSYLRMLTAHQWWAIGATSAAVLAAILRCARRKHLRRDWLAIYCVLMAAMAVCIALAGHSGGQLVYGKNFLADLF